MLVGLYEEPERPPNAVEYIKKYLGAAIGEDVDALKAENERLKAEVDNLKQEIEDLNAKVSAAHSKSYFFQKCHLGSFVWSMACGLGKFSNFIFLCFITVELLQLASAGVE